MAQRNQCHRNDRHQKKRWFAVVPPTGATCYGVVDKVGRIALVETQSLGADDFARAFGISTDEMPEACLDLIESLDFRYSVLKGEDRDKVILDVLNTLESDLRVSGPDRLDDWEKGWSENLRQYVESGFDSDALTPFYNRRGSPVMRLRGEYIRPACPEFEKNFLAVLEMWIAKKFLEDVDHVYEFGCGPSHHLAAFAKLYPDKRYHGLDWTKASQEIIEHIAVSQGAKIEGRWFDMFSPDETFHIEPNSVVITLDSMEQLGDRYRPFLEYLLAQAPMRCVHIEPVYELYDTSSLLDHLAARYSNQRGYLRGFLAALRELERSSQIVVHDVRKILGNMYHDGWSLVAWEPVRSTVPGGGPGEK